MDLKFFLPINTKIRVNLLIDAIQSEPTYTNLNDLELKIGLLIRNFKIQLYFKDKFKIAKATYVLKLTGQEIKNPIKIANNITLKGATLKALKITRQNKQVALATDTLKQHKKIKGFEIKCKATNKLSTVRDKCRGKNTPLIYTSHPKS